MSYSQNDEEQAIIAFFGDRKARFLDIGAHDGVRLSNTRRLFELGWTGTLVEPSPAAFCALMETYREHSGMELVNAALIVGDTCEFLKFFDSHGDFVSTLDDKHRELWSSPGGDGRKGVDFQPIHVIGMPVAKLLYRFSGPFAFVNLDVEGINFELFTALCKFGLQQLGVELICVEYQDKLRDIELLAAQQGYHRYHVTNENTLLVRR
jgi:FkbM family methyltransferase